MQPALEVDQDVHLLTVKFFEGEELGEVKLPILKERNDRRLAAVAARHMPELEYCPGQLIGVVCKDLQTGDPLSGWNTL